MVVLGPSATDRRGHRAAESRVVASGGSGRRASRVRRTGGGRAVRRFPGYGGVMMVELRGDVVRVDEVPVAIPAEPGLYAWWSLPGALPGISGPLHPDGERELAYVGIA